MTSCNFRVGQKVVCVDASPAKNPWHQRHPLILKRIYTVHRLFNFGSIGPGVDIDGSGRGWPNRRFRPVVQRKTDISIFKALLTPSKEKVETAS